MATWLASDARAFAVRPHGEPPRALASHPESDPSDLGFIASSPEELGIDSKDPAAPRRGKTPFERHRRLWTLLFGIAIGLSLLTTASRWDAMGVAGEFCLIAGMTLAMVGSLGRLWCGLFISGYKSRELIVSGAYSLCRNPLYLFSAIGLLGIGISTVTLSIPIAMVLSFALYYPRIIAREERRLLAIHGEVFEAYCQLTPAFWPRFRLYHEPESYVIRLRALRRNFIDSIWFVVLAALVRLVVELHSRAAWPVWIHLW